MITHPKILADKAMAQLNAGQFKSAYKTAKTAAKMHPRESFFVNLCGLAQTQMGDVREAISYFRKALRILPSNIDAQNNLIQSYVSIGETERAQEMIQKLLPKRQDHDNLLYLLAMTQSNAGDHVQAEATLDALIAQYPTLARAYNLRGAVRYAIGKEEGALADYRKALALKPNSPDVLTNISLLLSRISQMDEALEAVEHALELAPTYVLGLQRYGNILNELGRPDDARETYFRILEAHPTHAETLMDLSAIPSPETRDRIMALIDGALAKVAKGSMEYAQLALAKARLHLKAAERAEADQWYAAGNAAHARLMPYNTTRAERDMAATLAMFPQGYGAPEGIAPFEPRPIFVLGLPRSGTTLTEQMISSHADVFGAGELPGIERFARKALEEGGVFDAEAARRFAERYRASLPDMPEGTRAFVDKMPGNYKRIGFILAALPNAVIVNIRRDPREVALSMWHTTFTSTGLAFTYDQAQMARELNDYRRVMAHWETVFPGRIETVTYEELVSDTEAASKRLAEVCGLEWRAEMATPERNTKAVRTASVNQVRQPVHKGSLASWTRHEAALAELIAGLDRDLWPELAD